MDEEKKVMLQEIAMQPDFVRDNIDRCSRRCAPCSHARPERALGQGFMIGCGDSYCAALAARHLHDGGDRPLRRAGRGAGVLALPRRLLPAEFFVFGISNSGTVSRTIEGVRLARERGAWTFAVTVSEKPSSRETARNADQGQRRPQHQGASDGTRVVTPGSVTYTASMLGLFVAGIALGEKVGHLDQKRSAALVGQLRRLPDSMAAADRAVRPVVEEIAASFSPGRKTVILGGGPNYATAYFGMAKWHEALTRPCHTSELEEWAHEEYFVTDANTDTIVLLPPGAAPSRGLEQAAAAREMDLRVIIIGADDDGEARRAADVYFGMPPGVPEPLTPFVYKLPFEYLSCQIAHEQKIPFLGFHNPKRQQVNFRQIFNSAQSAKAG